MKTDRRTFLAGGAALSLATLLPCLHAETAAPTKPLPEVARKRPPLPGELVFPFVVAGHSNLPKVKQLLTQEPTLLNASWDWGGGDWETALAGASHLGNREIAHYLLGEGANIDAYCAAMLGEHRVLLALLEANPATARAKGPHGLTLLYHVAISGRVDTAEALHRLLPSGAKDYDQALSAAARGGHVDMTRWLLANGVTNPNQPDGTGKTALTYAVEKGFAEIASELQKHGARAL